MKQKRIFGKRAFLGITLAVCLISGFGSGVAVPALASESSGYFDESGLWVTQEDSTGADMAGSSAALQQDSSVSAASEADEAGMTGTYPVAEGWSEDTQTEEQAENDGVRIYRRESGADGTETSTITCSYMDTAYSVLEYEQLRDMLTNNLLYNNVNAQISTSAVYTLAKDYLYIVLVDDSSEAYRDIYHYVVGDYRCFCVQVREYRAEAQQMEAENQKTPQEAGKSMAEGFTWSKE